MKDNKHIQRFTEHQENLNISGVSCSIEDIKKWVDGEIGYYDPDDCEWNYTIEQAIGDMLYNFKTHFLKIELDETFENEKELIKYFKSEWKQYYN